jgi:hypothetical protein
VFEISGAAFGSLIKAANLELTATSTRKVEVVHLSDIEDQLL